MTKVGKRPSACGGAHEAMNGAIVTAEIPAKFLRVRHRDGHFRDADGIVNFGVKFRQTSGGGDEYNFGISRFDKWLWLSVLIRLGRLRFQ